MFRNVKNIYYKELFLYGFYISYIGLTSIATLIDFAIENYGDALVDLISVIVSSIAFWFYLKNKEYELASIILFWIASAVVFLFVIQNEFDISIIFTLLIPLVAFILLSTKRVILHVGIYFVLLGLIFAYGYQQFDTHPLLYEAKHMSAYVIAMLFVISFGIFYHIAIEQSFRELELANDQKTFLLKEIHHRVKNNLNIISSILGLQKLESTSKEVHDLIDQNRLRLESIAMAHEILYRYDSLTNIDFESYVKRLTEYILKTESQGNIDVEINVVPLKLSIETMIQFGLLVNELMTNSIKYAFSEGGKITLSLSKLECGYQFLYADNGRGYKQNENSGFGQLLIEMTVEQLNGTLLIESDKGVCYRICLKGLDDENINS